jgi:hypothetical protein
MGNCKKITAVFVLLQVMSGWIYGQSNLFNLSEYKLPDLERHTLDFNFNLTGNNSFRTMGDDTNSPEYSSHNIRNNLSANYTYFLNNEQNQRNYRVNFYANSQLSGNKDPESDYLQRTNRSFYPRFSSSFINRFYKDERRFFEVSPGLQYELNSDYYKNYGVEGETSFLTSNFSLILPLRVGLGRIEPVQDARQSVFIFDALEKVKRTSSEKTDQEILELARFISKLKNMRIFDSRMQRIYELEALDSLLKAKNHILQNDGTYFATLNDFWEFGGSPTRLSGQRASLALIPGLARTYHLDKDLDSNEILYEGTTGWISFYGGFEYVREKPIDLTWQNSVYANIYGGLIRENWVENEQSFLSPSLLLDVSQKWGYYPNTRTSASLLYRLQFTRVFDAVSSDEMQYIYSSGISGIKTSTQFNISYFVSPRMRFTGYLNFDYIWQSSESNLNINYYFMPDAYDVYNSPYSLGLLVVGRLINSYGVTLNYSLF